MQGYFRAYSKRVREATRDLDENNLRVYMALLSFANCEGKCWPGIAKLVSTTGVCTDGIYAALDALAAQGYIIIVRTGARDPETRQQLPNIYKIDGAVIDDDCEDDEYRTDDPILSLSSTQESKHHQRTDSLTNQKAKQQETPPPTQPISSKVEVRKPNTTAKTQTPETPTRSVNTNFPDNVPQKNERKFYSATLVEFAQPLAPADEEIAVELRSIDARLTIRMARYLVVLQGVAYAKWAISHFRKQTNVFNPAGYIRALIERHVVEAVDAEPINPGDVYITGAFADYIDH